MCDECESVVNDELKSIIKDFIKDLINELINKERTIMSLTDRISVLNAKLGIEKMNKFMKGDSNGQP
jgi:hypothetical protein